MSKLPTLLIVPGLREDTPEHWQQQLLAQVQGSIGVVPMGRKELNCQRRVLALEAAAQAISGPLILVAHSGGCLTVAHWALSSRRNAHAALMAVPPDFERPMPEGYPALHELKAGGWLPVPRTRLPFRSIVAASGNDPLAEFDRVSALAEDWGSELVDLGDVGHLNPASGFGPWPQAHELIARLACSH